MKVQFSCSIPNYLEKAYPEVYEIITATCSNLSNLKNKNGITFLLPVDKTVLKKIKGLLESDDANEFTRACNMINAMTIYDVMNDASDWMDKKDDIPNALRQHVEIDGVSGQTVKFKGGATAVHDPNFKPRVDDPERGPRLQVWLLTGEIPITTDKPAMFKHRLKRGEKPKPKTGGYSPSVSMLTSLRWNIAIAVENVYMFENENARRGTGSNAFLDYTLSFVRHVIRTACGSGGEVLNKSRHEMLFNFILPNISYQLTDMYVILEPHLASSSYMIPDDVIAEWWGDKRSFDFDTAGTIRKIDHLLSNPPAEYRKCAMYSQQASIIEACSDEVGSLADTINARTAVTTVSNFYRRVIDSNSISGIGSLFPPALVRYYQANPHMKLVTDEMRYIVYLTMERMNNTTGFNRVDFANVINVIGDYMHRPSEAGLKLFNAAVLASSVDPSSRISEMRIFMNSTNFMYIPLPSKVIENFPIKSVITKPDPFNIEHFNTVKATALQHQRLLDGATANINEHVIALLERLAENGGAISDEAKNKMRQYL